MSVNNKDIHVGFDQKEIRDFLSQSLVKCYSNIPKVNLPNKKADESFLEFSIRQNVSMSDHYMKLAEIGKQQLAIIKLIEVNNWKEHDCSDETLYDIIDFIDTIARISLVQMMSLTDY